MVCIYAKAYMMQIDQKPGKLKEYGGKKNGVNNKGISLGSHLFTL